MATWEHQVMYITWDGQQRFWTNGQRLANNIAELLDTLGAEGWELVSVSAAHWEPTLPLTGGGGDIDRWAAFFKRRKL